MSASGVALSHDKGSQDQVDQVGKYQTIKEWDDRKNVGSTGEEGRDYIADKYPDLIIIDGKVLYYSNIFSIYSKAYVKRSLKNRQNKDLNNNL